MKKKKTQDKSHYKEKESNKSQSNVIAVVLIILLCLIAIVILWKLVFPMSENTQQETDIQQELTKTTIGIDDVVGNLVHPVDNKLDIILSRGVGEMKFINQTIKNYTVVKTITTSSTIVIKNNISLVSVIDISGSMGDTYVGECKINKSNACCTTKNCSNSTGCPACGGSFSNNECYLMGSCRNNKANCIGGSCKGKWRNKLNLTQEANINFTDTIFNLNPDISMGVVAFTTDVNSSDCEPSGCSTLTNNKAALKNKINSFTAQASTNICQGLNKSITMLKSSTNNIKIIVLMSDGEANVACSTGDPKTVAIAQAVIANQSNITIFTIGFGSDADNITLKKIANATTNGSFYYADISQLSNIYDSISQTIPTTGTVEITENGTVTDVVYEPVQIWQVLRVIVYNDSSSFKYDMPKNTPILAPQESKEYTIDTGGLTNINKIDIYLVVETDDGRETSQLVASWTANS